MHEKSWVFFSYFQELFCISFTVILSKMWNIRVKSMIWRPFPLIIRAIQIFHSSLSFVERRLRPIVYQSHSQCIIVTFQEASSFANILWRFDNKKSPRNVHSFSCKYTNTIPASLKFHKTRELKLAYDIIWFVTSSLRIGHKTTKYK